MPTWADGLHQEKEELVCNGCRGCRDLSCWSGEATSSFLCDGAQPQLDFEISLS